MSTMSPLHLANLFICGLKSRLCLSVIHLYIIESRSSIVTFHHHFHLTSKTLLQENFLNQTSISHHPIPLLLSHLKIPCGEANCLQSISHTAHQSLFSLSK